MRTLRCRSLPGVPEGAAPYEFHLDEEDLLLTIPADHRGPDVAFALRPEQERWLGRWPGGLQQTWDCQWTFRDRAALEQFVTDLRASTIESPIAPATVSGSPSQAAAPASPAPASPPSRAASLPAGADEGVLEGGAPGNWVEVARVGDVAVSVGLCEGRPRPWWVAARRGADRLALDALVAHWSKSFPHARGAPAPRARGIAEELCRHERLWVVYQRGGIDGAETYRLLDLGDRAALESLGKRRKLRVFETAAAALEKVGPADVACGLAIPTAPELQAIASLGAPRVARPRKPKAISASATSAERLAEAFRRLESAGVLARLRVAGPPSEAWQRIGVERRRDHGGAVFTRAARGGSLLVAGLLRVYWASWDPALPPIAFAQRVVDVLQACGLDATLPTSEDDSIAVTP